MVDLLPIVNMYIYIYIYIYIYVYIYIHIYVIVNILYNIYNYLLYFIKIKETREFKVNEFEIYVRRIIHSLL